MFPTAVMKKPLTAAARVRYRNSRPVGNCRRFESTLRGDMAKRLSTVAAIATCAIAIPGAALANGRLPAGHQFAISPADPSFFVVETAFGVLVSHDTGKTWSWVCEKAIGYGLEGGTEDPTLGLMSKSVLAGLSEGLAASTDEGCSWAFSLNDPIIDLVVQRNSPHSALVLTSKYSGVGDVPGKTPLRHPCP